MSEHAPDYAPDGPEGTSGPTVDVRALRALAASATPGPWFDRGADDSYAMSAFYVTTNSGRSHDLDGLGGDEEAEDVVAITLLQRPGLACIADERWEENAAYIAAFNPATTLVLLDQLEQLEAALEFYADEDAYRVWDAGGSMRLPVLMTRAVLEDGGQRARDALDAWRASRE